MSFRLSLTVFGFYLIIVAGCGLMFVPNVMLGLFGFPAAQDAWIRMVGALALIIGAYYLVAARHGLVEVARWSVPLRLFAATFMATLFATKMLPIGIMLFASVDVLGALWTWASLRKANTQKGHAS